MPKVRYSLANTCVCDNTCCIAGYDNACIVRAQMVYKYDMHIGTYRVLGMCAIAPQALLLLLVRTQTRGFGANRYEVESPLHLAQCSGIPARLWEAYTRQ